MNFIHVNMNIIRYDNSIADFLIKSSDFRIFLLAMHFLCAYNANIVKK